jgi:hypothetical protein
MSPAWFVLLCLGITLIALTIDAVDDLRRRSRLRRLAAASALHFAGNDRFNLVEKVARAFPVPGAARPTVADVIYGRRDNRYYYVFRFDYTVGGAARPQRRRAIVGFSEPRQTQAEVALASAEEALTLKIAPSGAEILAQYQQLIAELVPAGTAEQSMPPIAQSAPAARQAQ